MNYSEVMTFDEFKLFRDLIYKECGIFFKEGKRDFLKIRIERRLKTLNIRSYFNYYRHVKDDKKELWSLLDCITINETTFFRNMPQFELFKERVLPELIEKKQKTGDYNLMFWSAGCATGEEPYSIAIETVEAIPDTFRWNLRIIATDISLRCLKIAQDGTYPKEKIRDVPEKYFSKYFVSSDDLCKIKDDVKRFVIFDYHNLKHENGINNIDIIFCRNVMIYFDTEEQKRITEKFQKVLNTGGYLFLGQAESLHGLTNGNFKFHCWNKGTAYQKVK